LERWNVGHENSSPGNPIFFSTLTAKILTKFRIGTEDFWSLSGCDFSNKGVLFTIVGTESTGPGIYEASHTIKNVKSGAYSNIPMLKLINILLESE
jgi:hypothetical protein